jgi:hypothetical protein
MRRRIQIQGDSGGKLNSLLGDSIGNCEKKLNMDMCLILNGYRDIATKISRPYSVRFLFVGLVEERSLQNKGVHTRRIARSHFGCCFPHKGT